MKSNKKALPKQTAVPSAQAKEIPAGFAQWRTPLAVLGLLFVLFQVYGPALNGPFVFDDRYLPFAVPGLAEKASLLEWVRGNRPLLMLTYWLNYKASGDDPYYFKVVNILLHFATSYLVMMSVRGVIRKTIADPNMVKWMSWFAGALFLLHPLQSETVGYVASRSDGLSVFFFFAAFVLFVYRLYDEIQGFDVLVVLIPFGAACLSKEHAAILPALLILTDYYFTSPYSWSGAWRNWRLYAPIFILGGIGVAAIYYFVLSRSDSAGFGMRDITWYQYFFTQCRALWFYMLLFVLPAGQNVDYDFPISRTIFDNGAIGFLAGLLVLVFLAWRYRKEYPLASYGFFAFLILMAPTSSFVPIKDPFVERRIYLSMFGLLLVAIEFLRRLKLSKPVLGAALGTILVVYSAAAWNRNHVWGSAVALWSDTVAKSPNKARPHMQLAYALQYEAGNCQGAVSQYALSAKIEPPDYRALVDAALASDCAGDTTSAIDLLKKAAAMEHSAHAYSQLGMMFAKAKRTSEALNALSEAERLDAGFDMTYAYRGNIFLTMEDRPQAIEQYQKALAINKTNEVAKNGLAQAQAPPSKPKPAAK